MTKEEKEKAGVLKRFMIEHFPFTALRKSGFFKAEMKGDYEAQAARVCQFFGYETVYEYGAIEISCHLSKVKPAPDDPFVTVLPSIYE
ncbi:hypothetical protein [Dyadobacter sp. CY312]|uniref:hypothetical protein n=1 Tax=Dyadobacter sp. CY312 TaxID=2907303 RepID=UPI001F3769BD|nr:hypothetical protein [Dyadobacter sp. CY312]MCE7039213.1 hypothetical protein [Dyadobacter sp. CY312]